LKLSLNIELTDEQYQDLMKQSYDEIFQNPDMINALREVILDNFREFFSKDSSNFVEKALLNSESSRYYSSYPNYTPSALMKQIVEDATKEQKEIYTKEIQQVLEKIFNDTGLISSLLHDTIIECIRAGMSLGTSNMMLDAKNQRDHLEMLTNYVHELQDKIKVKY